jgi:hypothetical protein
MPHTERNPDGRFQPGQSGNPAGRPPGSRNKTTLAVEALIEGGAERMTKQLVELAGYGNLAAVRICLDRLAPRRKGRPIAFPLPRLEREGDALAAASAVAEGVGNGELTPGEAAELFRVIESFERVRQASDLGRRVAKLEKAIASGASAGARAESGPGDAPTAAPDAIGGMEVDAVRQESSPAMREAPPPEDTGESTGLGAAANAGDALAGSPPKPDGAPVAAEALSPETTGESTGGSAASPPETAPAPARRRPEPPEWPEWPEYPQYLALQERLRREREMAG